MELSEGPSQDNVATPMFYDADLDTFDHEDEPLKVSPYMLKSFQFVKDKTTGYYACQFCSYRSMHRSSIKSHLAVHSSARPFACGMCEYEAKRVNDLRKHWLIKHGKRLATRSRGYRPRVSPSSSGSVRAESDNGSMVGESGLVSATSGTQSDAADHPAYALHRGEPSKWLDNSNQLVAMPVYPEPELCLENAVASSPHSELNDVDMDLIDAEDEDMNHTDLFLRSGDEELVVVKPEPPQDEFYQASSKGVKEDTEENKDSIASLCKGKRSSQESKDKRFTDENGAENSPKDSLSPKEASLVNANTPVTSSLRNSHSPVMSRINNSQSSTASLLRNNQSPSNSLLQTKNVSGASLMAQAYSNDSKLNRKQYSSECMTSSAISAKNQLQYSWASDSSNSTTVTSSAVNSRHASVGTNRGWLCAFCNIQFFDNAIYFMHMGLHDRRDPWKCTVCGKRLYDVYSFTSHFVNGHS